MNLFLNTQKLTKQKEDLLTEFIAGALILSDQFRTDYEAIVLKEYAQKKVGIILK